MIARIEGFVSYGFTISILVKLCNLTFLALVSRCKFMFEFHRVVTRRTLNTDI